MKRILIIVLCVAMLNAIFLIPASAAETQGLNFSVLDFATANNSGSNYFSFINSGSFNYNISQTLGRMRCYSFSIVYTWTGESPTFSSISSGSTSFSVTVDNMSTGISYASGDFGGYALQDFNLNFTNTGSQSSYITILGFVIFSVPQSVFNVPCRIGVNNRFITVAPGSSGTATDTALSDIQSTFIIDISKSYWSTFDYIDFSFSVASGGIVDISAFDSSDQNLPLTTSYLSGSANGDWHIEYCNVRLDLTKFDKGSSEGLVRIIVNCIQVPNSASSLTLTGCVGSVPSAPVDSEIVWYRVIWNSIVDGFNSVVTWSQSIWNSMTKGFQDVVKAIQDTLGSSAPEADKEAAESEQQKVEQTMDDAIGLMPSMPSPDDVGDIGEAVAFVYEGSFLISVFNNLWSVDIIQYYLLLSAVLCFAAYVVFGKW